ncbi:MAG: molybdopterin-binding protein [Candidatus Bathyarchaeota archaeon]|jgi:molybdenum cofactor synthesis domain-containing protein
MNGMTPFKELISYKEALRCIRKNIFLIKRIESIPISEASYRVLAEDILADINVPPFNRAAMDGYAVRSEDTLGASQHQPRTLKLVGILHAGMSTERKLHKGECVQIATGSPTPDSTDAVVMVEFTEREGDIIKISKPVYSGANISPMGEDIQKGQTVLKREEQLTPARLGASAALGIGDLKVYQKPRILVVPTGTEIQQMGKPLEKGQIYDVNSYTISSIIEDNGCKPERSSSVPDKIENLRALIKSSHSYDMIVFSGGSSVGERDLVTNIIKELGTILFHGIQIKPGKPTLFALISDKPVFGMPGYPTSCLLNTYLFLIPAIRQMARLPPKTSKSKNTKLGKRVVSSSGRTQFLPVKLMENMAYPVFKQSGAITSMTKADGYIRIPINVDTLEKDQEVEVHLFD